MSVTSRLASFFFFFLSACLGRPTSYVGFELCARPLTLRRPSLSFCFSYVFMQLVGRQARHRIICSAERLYSHLRRRGAFACPAHTCRYVRTTRFPGRGSRTWPRATCRPHSRQSNTRSGVPVRVHGHGLSVHAVVLSALYIQALIALAVLFCILLLHTQRPRIVFCVPTRCAC